MDAVSLALPLLTALIVVALAFDFLNGLHDAANSIATIVSTRVLRPQHAVAWAAFFNFIAFLVFGAHVAQTVGTGIVSADVVDPRVVFEAGQKRLQHTRGGRFADRDASGHPDDEWNGPVRVLLWLTEELCGGREQPLARRDLKVNQPR